MSKGTIILLAINSFGWLFFWMEAMKWRRRAWDWEHSANTWRQMSDQWKRECLGMVTAAGALRKFRNRRRKK